MPLFLSYMFAFRAVILSFVPLSPVRTAKFASQLMVTDGNDVHASVVRARDAAQHPQYLGQSPQQRNG